MEIRPAKIDDIPAVLEMMRVQNDYHRSMDPAKYDFKSNALDMYSRWLASRATDPRSVFLVAQREEKLVGFCVAAVERDIPVYNVEEMGFVHDIYVDPNYRHEGIARQMVTLIIEKFTNMGMKQIRLDTAAPNEASRKLFASCGFRVSMVEMLLELKPK